MDVESGIDVKNYLNVFLFLQDYYSYRKLKDKSFSYQKWAYEIGITSKSYLRFAVFGQRKISEKLTQQFCIALKLASADQDYFVQLIHYSYAKNPEQKKSYGRKLTQILKTPVAINQVKPADDVMADPIYMIVRNVLTFCDIDRSIESIAKLVSLSVEKTAIILAKLQDEKLIHLQGAQWLAVHDIVKVPAQPGNLGILNFHKKSLLKAIESQKEPVSERAYRSLTLALNEKEFKEYQQDVNFFVSQIFEKYDTTQLKDRRVYQINLNSIPWTKRPAQ